MKKLKLAAVLGIASIASITASASPLRDTCETLRNQFSQDFVSEGQAAHLASWEAQRLAIHGRAFEVASALNQFLAELDLSGQQLVRAYGAGLYPNRSQLETRLRQAVERVQGSFERVECDEGSGILDDGIQPPACRELIEHSERHAQIVDTPPRSMRTIRYISGHDLEMAREQVAHAEVIANIERCWSGPRVQHGDCNGDALRTSQPRRTLRNPFPMVRFNGNNESVNSLIDAGRRYWPILMLTPLEDAFHDTTIAEINADTALTTSYIEACSSGPTLPNGQFVRVCRQLPLAEISDLATTAQMRPDHVISVEDIVARFMPVRPPELATWVQQRLSQQCQDELARPAGN